MYKAEAVLLAKAVRDGANEAGLDVKATKIIADHIAAVCAQRAIGEGTFDTELFMAYALAPTL